MKYLLVALALVANIYAFDLGKFVDGVKNDISSMTTSDSVTKESGEKKVDAIELARNKAVEDDLNYKKSQAESRYQEKIAEIALLEKELEKKYSN